MISMISLVVLVLVIISMSRHLWDDYNEVGKRTTNSSTMVLEIHIARIGIGKNPIRKYSQI